MKRTSVLILWCMAFLSSALHAQSRVEITNKVTPLHLGIGYSLTTNLIFPYGIKSVDKGSKDILVQKAKGVENVLQLKAGKENFEVTNLTVVTSDGQLYSFLLGYDPRPSNLNIELAIASGPKNPEVIFSSADDNEASRNATAEQVALKKRTLRGLHAANYSIKFCLIGLYIKNDLLYFQLELDNASNINYDIDQLRFFIRDQKKSKRTASQELELKPQQLTGNHKVIRSGSRQVVVAVLPKLTIPEKKYLDIELNEAGGGRHLSFRLYNKHLIHSTLIN